ncbi:hypothetical protein KDN24_17170 [Bacillus sp. Bva_UNVM-123]|uniref:hypothetical protein n=1 Tax=Bacillus sp. Bva_UNVM-123 TaxID=2829798 RepID=UPI00391F1064
MSTGTIAVVLVFAIPIIAIITDHFQKQTKLKHKMIQGELELEKLKHENYLLETQKLRLELEQQLQLEDPNDKKNIM